MITNFSPKRLGHILYWNISPNFKKKLLPILIAYAGIIALQTILFSYNYYSQDYISSNIGLTMNNIFELSGTIFLFFMIIKINSEYVNKGNLTNWLMLPASEAEKFSAILIQCFIFYPICYLGIWIFSELLRLGVMSIIFWGSSVPFQFFFPVTRLWTTDNLIYRYLFFMAILSFFFLGSFIFRKHPGIKTILTIMAVNALHIIVFLCSIPLLYNSDMAEFYSQFITFAHNATVFFSQYNTSAFIIAGLLLTICINLSICYLRFRESEIIHRH